MKWIHPIVDLTDKTSIVVLAQKFQSVLVQVSSDPQEKQYLDIVEMMCIC